MLHLVTGLPSTQGVRDIGLGDLAVDQEPDKGFQRCRDDLPAKLFTRTRTTSGWMHDGATHTWRQVIGSQGGEPVHRLTYILSSCSRGVSSNDGGRSDEDARTDEGRAARESPPTDD
jgi:hypothetical protein